jgi:hypothetical protein
MPLDTQIIFLFVLAIPVACIAWTVTHEEVFRESRDFCLRCSQENRFLLIRKFFYLFTCEYCFSHYITVGILFLSNYRLIFDDWRGYIIAGFSLVWVANIYMSLFYRIRIVIKKEKLTIEEKEEKGTVDNSKK